MRQQPIIFSPPSPPTPSPAAAMETRLAMAVVAPWERHVFAESSAGMMDLSAIDWENYSVEQFIADFPSLSSVYEMYQAGYTPAQAAVTAKGFGKNLAICSVISSILMALEIFVAKKAGLYTQLQGKIADFYQWLFAMCGLVFTYIDIDSNTPADCPSGEVWSDEFKTCVSEKMGWPCSDVPNGHIGRHGDCIPCGPGTHYDAEAKGCAPGCQSGWVLSAKWGCVPEGYNQPCDYEGKKGVVTPDGNCTLDGCDDGFRYDFDTETCVPVSGSTQPVKNVPLNPAQTPIDDAPIADKATATTTDEDKGAKSGISWGSVLMGTGLVILGVGLAWKASTMPGPVIPERLENPTDDEVARLAREMGMTEDEVRRMLSQFAEQHNAEHDSSHLRRIK